MVTSGNELSEVTAKVEAALTQAGYSIQPSDHSWVKSSFALAWFLVQWSLGVAPLALLAKR